MLRWLPLTVQSVSASGGSPRYRSIDKDIRFSRDVQADCGHAADMAGHTSVSGSGYKGEPKRPLL